MTKLLRIQRPLLCPLRKCGEHNMLKCINPSGHDDPCCWIVDRENDYAHQDGKPMGVECAECEPCHVDILIEICNRI